MNKYFKKLFSLFLVFTIGTLGVVFTTQSTFASTSGISYRVGSSGNQVTTTGREINIYDEDGWIVADIGNGDSGYVQISDSFKFSLYLTAPEGWAFKYRVGSSGNQITTTGREFNIYDEDDWIIADIGNGDSGYVQISQSMTFSLYLEIYQIKTPDNTRPAIDGQENAVTNVNNPEDVNFFVKLFRAIDDVDGDISDRIVIDNDGYTANKNKLGKYPVTISATDDAGNKATLTFYINVVDIDNPIITGDATKARISYDKTFDVEGFRKTLDISDNYDVLANSAITITSNTYDSNKTKIGNYQVVFTAKDSSNNSTTFTKQIEVYDGVKPSFSGITTFTKGYNKIISVQEIIKDVKANDYIDGDITNTIKIKRDGYTGNANKVGTYEVELEVSDKAGNKAQHLIKITVTDDKGADWYIENGYTINLAPDATLTRTQIVELLVRNKQVNASANSRITYTYDNYSDNVGEPGVYVLGFTITEPNGNESAHEYAINVMSSDDTNDDNQDTLPGDFEIKDHLKKYSVYYLIGIIAVAGLTVVVFRKK